MDKRSLAGCSPQGLKKSDMTEHARTIFLDSILHALM